MAYVHLPKTQRTKLDACVIRCIFLGYGVQKKGYQCYDPTTRRLYTTMDVIFLELAMFFCTRDTHSLLQGERMNEDQNWVLENWMTWDYERDLEGQEALNHIAENKKDLEGQEASKHITEHRDSEEHTNSVD